MKAIFFSSIDLSFITIDLIIPYWDILMRAATQTIFIQGLGNQNEFVQFKNENEISYSFFKCGFR